MCETHLVFATRRAGAILATELASVTHYPRRRPVVVDSRLPSGGAPHVNESTRYGVCASSQVARAAEQHFVLSRGIRQSAAALLQAVNSN